MMDITWVVFLLLFIGIPAAISLFIEDIDVESIPFDDEDELEA